MNQLNSKVIYRGFSPAAIKPEELLRNIDVTYRGFKVKKSLTERGINWNSVQRVYRGVRVDAPEKTMEFTFFPRLSFA